MNLDEIFHSVGAEDGLMGEDVKEVWESQWKLLREESPNLSRVGIHYLGVFSPRRASVKAMVDRRSVYWRINVYRKLLRDKRITFNQYTKMLNHIGSISKRDTE